MNNYEFETLVYGNQAKLDCKLEYENRTVFNGVTELYIWAMREFEGKKLCNIFPITINKKEKSIEFMVTVEGQSIWLGDIDVYLDRSGGFLKRLLHGELTYSCGGIASKLGYELTLSQVKKNLLYCFASVTRQELASRMPKKPEVII